MKEPKTYAEMVGDAEAGRISPYSFEGETPEALLQWGRDMGYALRNRTGFYESGVLRGLWFSWTDDALDKQGFKATADEYFEAHTDRPAGFDLSTFGYWVARPQLVAVSGRRDRDDAKSAERYRVTAESFAEDGRVPGARVPELHARVEAIHRRMKWEMDRLADSPDLDGWLRVLWREVQKAFKHHVERGEDGRANLLRRKWEELRDRRIGVSATIPKTMKWAEMLLRDDLGLDTDLCRAQLSGLAFILHRREPIVERLVTWRDTLDVYDSILEAALLDVSPLSDESLRRAEASRRDRPGRPTVGDVEDRWTLYLEAKADPGCMGKAGRVNKTRAYEFVAARLAERGVYIDTDTVRKTVRERLKERGETE